MLTGTQGITPMDLQTTIMDVLRRSGQALTFEDVVKCVAQKLEGDVRVTLNELVAKEQILLHVGDRNRRWRYQALPMKRRF
jgi:predicted transcriptional regulator